MTQQNRDATRKDQDDVRQADESGEPRRSGWSHGHPVADDDPRQQQAGPSPANTDPDRPADKKGGAVGEDLESGRQGSV
ncbi:MAG TPA: hypothetical protein VFB66_12200 [Tepidisphaeraceae bacterium]|nr:hypothetical protein [Tepidisphaeraceae bacterium]